MNITPAFLSSPKFIRLERKLGVGALSFLVKLGIVCQQTKSNFIEIDDVGDLEIRLGITEGGKDVLMALEELGMISKGEGSIYECHFFLEQNKQLLSNWKNGESFKKKSKELKSTQSNSNQLNSTQSNSTQFNSTQSTANSVPTQCQGSASKYSYPDLEPF